MATASKPSPEQHRPATDAASGPSIADPRVPSAFALTGPSHPVDPLVHAVRADVADISLAGRVVTSHYAAAARYRAVCPVPIGSTRAMNAKPVGALMAGNRFDVFDIAGEIAWGQAVTTSLVGYVPLNALEPLP